MSLGGVAAAEGSSVAEVKADDDVDEVREAEGGPAAAPLLLLLHTEAHRLRSDVPEVGAAWCWLPPVGAA